MKNNNEIMLQLSKNAEAIREIVESDSNLSFKSFILAEDEIVPDISVLRVTARDKTRNLPVTIIMDSYSIKNMRAAYLPHYTSEIELLSQNPDARSINTSYVMKMYELYGDKFIDSLRELREGEIKVFKYVRDKAQEELDMLKCVGKVLPQDLKKVQSNLKARVMRHNCHIELIKNLISEIDEITQESENV